MISRREILKSLVAIPIVGLAQPQVSIATPPLIKPEKFVKYLVTDKGKKILSGTTIQNGVHHCTHFVIHDKHTNKVVSFGRLHINKTVMCNDTVHLDWSMQITE